MARQGIRITLGDREFAQHVNVSAEYAKSQITLESDLAVVAATLQAVTTLQCTDRGLNPRVTFASVAKFDGRIRHTSCVLSRMLGSNARQIDNLLQLVHVLGVPAERRSLVYAA